jgi:hypothetical protein
MPHIRFARFLILESIPAWETLTGRQLFEALEPIPDTHHVPTTIEYVSVPGCTALESCLHDVRADAIRTNRIPLLHIECHGNDDCISLASGDFMPWDELCEHFNLNVMTRLNLFLAAIVRPSNGDLCSTSVVTVPHRRAAHRAIPLPPCRKVARSHA